MKQLKVCWISAGISSFIAGYLQRDTIDKFIYIDIEDQHPDSMRFIKDCEKALGKEIEILTSEYGSVENAIRTAGCIKMPNHFTPCTGWLKKRVRKQWELEHADYEITYVWGFDIEEKHRADRTDETMIEYNHVYPLIEKMLSKADVHEMFYRLFDFPRPQMYDMGYKNNNCVGCVKGGMGYWNNIRKDFPEVFKSRAKLERDIGASILKDSKTGESIYLDELEPNRGKMQDEVMPDCSIMCYLAMYDT